MKINHICLIINILFIMYTIYYMYVTLYIYYMYIFIFLVFLHFCFFHTEWCGLVIFSQLTSNSSQSFPSSHHRTLLYTLTSAHQMRTYSTFYSPILKITLSLVFISSCCRGKILFPVQAGTHSRSSTISKRGWT